MAWSIELIIILAAVVSFDYRMWSGHFAAPTIIEIGVLTVIPAVYLSLIYLTQVSQK